MARNPKRPKGNRSGGGLPRGGLARGGSTRGGLANDDGSRGDLARAGRIDLDHAPHPDEPSDEGDGEFTAAPSRPIQDATDAQIPPAPPRAGNRAEADIPPAPKRPAPADAAAIPAPPGREDAAARTATASLGTASAGSASPGTAAPGTASSGTASSGTASSGTAASTTVDEPAPDRPGTTEPATAQAGAAGPVPAETAAAEPVTADSGPAEPATAQAGAAGPGPTEPATVSAPAEPPADPGAAETAAEAGDTDPTQDRAAELWPELFGDAPDTQYAADESDPARPDPDGEPRGDDVAAPGGARIRQAPPARSSVGDGHDVDERPARRPARERPLVLGVAALVIGGGVAAAVVFGNSSSTPRTAASAPVAAPSASTSQTGSSAPVASGLTDWLITNIGKSQSIAADPQVAATLNGLGFTQVTAVSDPAAITDPNTIDWLVVTPQLSVPSGSGLADRLATAVPVAQFGSGQNTTQVRFGEPGSSAEVSALLAADRASRLTAGQALAANPSVTGAETDSNDALVQGKFDLRVATTLALAAVQTPVRIEGISQDPAEAALARPIRTVTVQVTKPAALTSVLANLPTAYRASAVTTTGDTFTITWPVAVAPAQPVS